MKEDLYKWYPIVDEGEYWLEDEVNPKIYPETCKRIYKDNMVTIVTNGEFLFNHDTSRLGWGTMAKQGCWKYMRIKLDDSICRDESFDDEICRLGICDNNN